PPHLRLCLRSRQSVLFGEPGFLVNHGGELTTDDTICQDARIVRHHAPRRVDISQCFLRFLPISRVEGPTRPRLRTQEGPEGRVTSSDSLIQVCEPTLAVGFLCKSLEQVILR